jgi:hypothetical protein
MVSRRGETEYSLQKTTTIKQKANIGPVEANGINLISFFHIYPFPHQTSSFASYKDVPKNLIVAIESFSST